MSLGDWLENRTGIAGALRSFLGERVPASVGWRNTLGSLAGALLLLQTLTGFLLALYYVPHPEGAYASLEYVREHVTLGAFVRALHYWGASFIVVAVFVHLMRVLVTGAYRKPRELTWLVGLALLGVVLGLAFTGQLLPYNQSGYWAAKVGVEIASSAPVIGPALRKMMLGGAEVGALTLTRFYALHVVLLPMLFGALVVLHLYLLRRHGPAPQPSESEGERIPFFPVPFFRDMVTISVGVVALAAVALIVKGPHSGPLDLNDTSYVPRPEWYFLSHYELLRFTPGPLKILTTFVLPAVIFTILIALPWLDRAKTSQPGGRRVIVGASLFAAAAIVGLTLFGLASTPEPTGDAAVMAEEEAGESSDIEQQLAAGRRAFQQLKCYDCHKIRGRGRELGPDLTFVGSRLREPYLRAWLRDPTAFNPDTAMPPVQTDDKTFESLVDYLLSLTREDL